jgi:hypothetical protein
MKMKNFSLFLLAVFLLSACKFGSKENGNDQQFGSQESTESSYNNENHQKASSQRKVNQEPADNDNTSSLVQVISSNVTYDENFNPQVRISVKNPTNKTVTNFVVVTCFAEEGSDRHDIFAQENVENKVNKIIGPYRTIVDNIEISLQHSDYKYNGSYIETVRFSDGSIQSIQ